jgi:hypothetical protein
MRQSCDETVQHKVAAERKSEILSNSKIFSGEFLRSEKRLKIGKKMLIEMARSNAERPIIGNIL